MTAYGEVAPNGIGLTKDGKVRLNNAMIIVSKSGRVFVSPYNSGWAELTFEARKLLYDYLQKEFADKPIEINLTPAVTDLLLKQAGFDLKSKSLSSEAERDKKLKELLAELGLTPHEKVVTAQGKRTIVAVYSLLIAKGTDVSPATPAELKDYIEKASSSLLGEDGVPSSGIVEFGGVNAATRAIAYSYSQFDSNEILVTANSGSTNPQQYKLTFEKRIEGPRKVENLVIAKVEKLVATTDMRTGAVTENWVDLVSAVKGPDGEIIKAYQPDFFSDANLFTVSAKRGYVRFYATAAMTFSGMPAVDSLDISALRSLSGRNILVVEDDPIQGTLIGNFLGSLEANANVTLVTSAEEALKLLADGKKFDHYVFDNNLGQGGGTKSGLDLASERINAGDKTPMTFASTDFDKADSKESLALAALMAANPTITGALGKINNFNNLLALAKQVASSAAGQAVVAVGVPQLTQQANDVSSSAAVGGIDFDPSLLNLQIKRNGKGVPLPLDQQNLENINIEGLYPVIINMQPATIQNFPFLSSVEKQEKVPELSMR